MTIKEKLRKRKERMQYVRALCDAEEAIRSVYSSWSNAFLRIQELSQRADEEQTNDIKVLRALLDAQDLDGLRLKIKEIKDKI